MPTTPSGLPAWSRTADPDYYGANGGNKENYQSQGAINPKTDITAEELLRLFADVAAAVRTNPFAVITYTADDTGTSDPTVHAVFMQTGVVIGDFDGGNPPTGFPSLTRQATGHTRVTFASSYTDEFGVSEAYAPQAALATVHSTSAAIATASITNVVRVNVYLADSSGTALADGKATVVVW